MLVTLLSALSALVISLLCTPAIRELAIRFNILAWPNHRTVHKNVTPKLGGLSIYLAFTVGLTIFVFFTQEENNLWGLLIGGSLVLLVGLFDDIKHLSCYNKLLGQTIAAIITVYFGFTIDTIYLPSGISLKLGYWAAPLSVFWIVMITNAVNLLDGLDGLASGFSIVIALFVLIGATIYQNVDIAATSFILIAASLGFLRYNFNPAKIFMGDMGSLFLGYALACLSLKAFTLPNTGSHIAILLVLFLIPLADTSLAILRRVSYGRHPFGADKKHIHHRLLELGLSQTSSVLVIYAATFLCGLTSLWLFVADMRTALILLSGIFLLSLFALILLGCFDFLTRKEYSKKLGEDAV